LDCIDFVKMRRFFRFCKQMIEKEKNAFSCEYPKVFLALINNPHGS
jgi:hypothetical protein